ncbi:hypothetical protein KBX37_01390 [Micromonospora sp. U56]|uniref:hypothetical protein n=1 Tax=Micromonospora sp. U56 TaxID=2824900 RepID=UPI001B38206C|nr:hypothetical protein [Micromonospora sp. U56]MBQ0891764.1 hypothetical protein [Micromonospora sp. U56]
MPGPGAVTPVSAFGAGASGVVLICSAVVGAGPGVAFFGVAFFGGVAFLGVAVFLGAAVRLPPESVVRLRGRAAARLCSGTGVWLSFSAAIELSPGVLVSLSPGALGWLASGTVGWLSPEVLVALSPPVPVRLSPGVPVREVVSLRGVAFLGVVRLVGEAGVSGCAAWGSATEIGGVVPELTGPVGSAAPRVTGATVVCRPGGACPAVEVLRFRARSAADVSAVTCPVISCSPAPSPAVPPLALAPAPSRPVGTSAGPVPGGSAGVPALPDAFLAGRGWRGSG